MNFSSSLEPLQGMIMSHLLSLHLLPLGVEEAAKNDQNQDFFKEIWER